MERLREEIGQGGFFEAIQGIGAGHIDRDVRTAELAHDLAAGSARVGQGRSRGGDDGDRGDVAVAGADGRSHGITFGANDLSVVRFPTWSPDGKQIAFEIQYLDEQSLVSRSRLGVVNADGSGRYDIPDLPIESRFPRWSPVP